jgi:hypothetical protein
VEQLEKRCLLSAITVDGSQQFQTISGFGTNLSSEAWNSGAVTPSLNTLLNHGYRLYRVIVEPVQGWEDANPNTGQYSDANPNWPYYDNIYGTSTKFSNLWNTISYLNNHGATVWLNLQSDAPAWMTDSGGGTGTIGQDHEADWATMVSTMMDYAVNVAHVHIDALGPMNEPDNPGDPVQGPQVDATQYVRMMDTLETQLQGYGLGNIPLVGPDNASSSDAVNSYAPAMLADPFLMPHVMQFGFHTYGSSVSDFGITDNSTYPGRQILSDEYDGNYFNEDHGQRATAAELWTQADQSFQNLVQIVGAGENGAIIWDGVDNFYEYYQQWSAHGLISYDWTAPNPTAQSDYGTTPRLYANAQMFQFVAPGSVVIGSSDNASNFIELAFKNPSGQITVVGEDTGSSSQLIAGTLTGGLTASLFNMYFTNSSRDEQQQGNVAVTGNNFSFTVPADTIFTLTTPAAPNVTGVTPISGLTSGGQSVTITGSNFTSATGVFFGAVAASSFTINSDTSITATTPANAAGLVDVTVTVPSGGSATATADQFQYVAVNGTASPTVANPASATVAANQASASLSVLAASQYAANTLTYIWATTGTPPAPVTFSTNGNNSASNVTASFAQARSYSFQATIVDPAGNSVTSSVAVTVSQVATTLTVSPVGGAVVPNATLQFSDNTSDQFGDPYTATPVSWTVNGGGMIDNTGNFTAGSVLGGPFTVTASAGGLNATASVTISANINVAPNGTAYRWFGLSSATSGANQTAAPGLNDNNLSTDVALSGGSDDLANAYEAAGVVWATPQSINKVTFINGSFISGSYDGVFDNNFGLQFTIDGTTWTSVSGWSLSPAYPYDLPDAAGVAYTFSGPVQSVLGFRVVGQVHSLTGNDSWFDNATEVQAFGVASVDVVNAAVAIPVTLIQENDHQHIDWIMGPTTARLLINDPNGLSIIGDPGNDSITLNYTSGNPLPNTLHLNGTFTISNLQGTNPLAGTSLEIGRSTVFISYSSSDPLAAINSYLHNGYANGAWNGTPTASTGVITSSAAAANYIAGASTTGIGYADSSDGQGINTVTNTIELTYTLYGDANLDGAVNAIDLQRLLFAFNTPGSWDQGDFNYDGNVNAIDLQRLLFNFNTSLGNQNKAGSADVTAHASQSKLQQAGITLAVPKSTTTLGTTSQHHSVVRAIRHR